MPMLIYHACAPWEAKHIMESGFAPETDDVWRKADGRTVTFRDYALERGDPDGTKWPNVRVDVPDELAEMYRTPAGTFEIPATLVLDVYPRAEII